MPEAPARNGAAAIWRPWTGMAIPVLLLQAGGDRARLALRYERDAVLAGEIWRLLTAHLVHLGWVHALMNLAGIALCLLFAPGAFHGHASFWRAYLFLAAAIGLAMLAWSPAIGNYVGLSGVVYGYFVLALLPRVRRDWLAGAALAVIAGWACWQLAAGPSPAEERLIGGRIVGVAHLYGMAAALALLVVAAIGRRWRRFRFIT